MANVVPGYTFTGPTDPITYTKLNLLGQPTVTIGAGEITPSMISAAAWASPSGPIGATTPVAGTFTTLNVTGIITTTQANGLIRLGGDTASFPAIRFDGTATAGIVLADQSTYAALKCAAFTASTSSAIGATISATTNLNLPAGTTGVSTIRLAHGVAPTAPVDGDMWTTTAGLYVRINGGTVGPLS